MVAAMADDAQIRATIDKYVATFSAGDRAGWLALWADDATMEDPVGTPVRHGRDEIGGLFDSARASADAVELRLTGVALVVAGEAAFHMEVRPTVGGQEMVMPAIDVMTFTAGGQIATQRAFVDFSQLRPA
jgi:steroid delta-isomerase